MELFANNFATQLTGPMTAGQGTLPAMSAAPSSLQATGGQFRVSFSDSAEICIVTAGQSGTTWTVTRGAEGTTPTSHIQGASVYHYSTAGALLAMLQGSNNLSDVSNAATARGNLGLGSAATQASSAFDAAGAAATAQSNAETYAASQASAAQTAAISASESNAATLYAPKIAGGTARTWTAVPFGTYASSCGYLVDTLGELHFRGLINITTLAVNGTLALGTMPAGARPGTANRYYTVPITNSIGYAQIYITIGGAVSIQYPNAAVSASTYFDLSNIEYMAEN